MKIDNSRFPLSKTIAKISSGTFWSRLHGTFSRQLYI